MARLPENTRIIPIKEMRVLSKAEVESKLRFGDSFGPTISIGDPGDSLPANLPARCSQFLRLEFDDVESAVPILGGLGGDAKVATHEQIRQAILFDERHRVEMVHCHMGVSRSAAIALILMCRHVAHGREQEMAEKLLDMRPIANPNMLVIELGDERLARKGALYRAARKIVIYQEEQRSRG